MLQALHNSDSHSSSDREGSSESDSDTDEDTSCTEEESVDIEEPGQHDPNGSDSGSSNELEDPCESDRDTDEDTCTEVFDPKTSLSLHVIVPDSTKLWWFLDIFNIQIHSENDHQIQ